MAQPKRHDPLPTPMPPPAGAAPWEQALPPGTGGEGDYAAGGQVGQMQAELAKRLARGAVPAAMPADRGERLIRIASVGGGLGALAAAYAAIAYAVLR